MHMNQLCNIYDSNLKTVTFNPCCCVCSLSVALKECMLSVWKQELNDYNFYVALIQNVLAMCTLCTRVTKKVLSLSKKKGSLGKCFCKGCRP